MVERGGTAAEPAKLKERKGGLCKREEWITGDVDGELCGGERGGGQRAVC